MLFRRGPGSGLEAVVIPRAQDFHLPNLKGKRHARPTPGAVEVRQGGQNTVAPQPLDGPGSATLRFNSSARNRLSRRRKGKSSFTSMAERLRA